MKRKKGTQTLLPSPLLSPATTTKKTEYVIRPQPMGELLDRLNTPKVDGQSLEQRMNVAIGAKTNEVALRVLAEVVRFDYPMDDPPDEKAVQTALSTATAQLAELEPENTTQTQLAAQMIGCHRLAMTFMRRAVIQGQDVDVVTTNVIRAGRLMRLYIDQIDAMARLKGKDVQQRVVVERVDINGGQAIVGAITAGGGGKTRADPQ